MDELGFDFKTAVSWFQHQQDKPYALVKLTSEQTSLLTTQVAVAVRRCYITDELLTKSALNSGLGQAEILNSKFPDPGSTMAGDFGEILCYFYQSTKGLPAFSIGAKKWRLKQDRTKPAPRSDVVHFVMPSRPNSGPNDILLCAEVKLKSTASSFKPIDSAIKDSEKDRTSRLAETLVWLRERAMTEPLGDIDIPVLNRFINLVDHPPVEKLYSAVAIICESLLTKELKTAPATSSTDYSLLVISVPNLKQTYEAVFAAGHATVPI
jgi:hypothetical protein